VRKKSIHPCCKSMCLQLLTIFRVEPTFLREIKWFLNTVIWKVDLIIKTVDCKHVYLQQGSRDYIKKISKTTTTTTYTTEKQQIGVSTSSKKTLVFPVPLQSCNSWLI
jgi:hypothetical protein